MEAIKQKIEGQWAPVVQIVTEEEYIELFGTKVMTKTFDGDWSEIGLESREETPETQSVRRRQHYRDSRIGLDKGRR